MKGIIYTGGHWLTSHFILGRDGGADIDQYIVEVPRGNRLEVSVIPLLSSVGTPYVELDDRLLQERSERLFETEPQIRNTVVVHSISDRSRDITFSVKGLFNNNYRRDTGPYLLTVKLTQYLYLSTSLSNEIYSNIEYFPEYIMEPVPSPLEWVLSR